MSCRHVARKARRRSMKKAPILTAGGGAPLDPRSRPCQASITLRPSQVTPYETTNKDWRDLNKGGREDYDRDGF
jgi:hypothetical protein